MASAVVRELLDSGIHFGHHASRWNPKMRSFIYGKRNSIHIIDIRETLRGLLRAQKFLSKIVAEGHDILFVGTKRQAREIVQQQAARCQMHSVTERWLGGTLTNFRTIRSRLQRLEQLEALVAGPQWETGYSKKMKSTLTRELEKIRRNLDGVRRLSRVPGAMVVVDVRREINAVREARSLGIPTICLIDTDSDPDFASIPIPGNDDAMRAITLVLSKLADACEEGLRGRTETPAEGGEIRDMGVSGPRRRGRRPMGAARGEGFGEEGGRGEPAAAPSVGAPESMGVTAPPSQPNAGPV